VTWVQWAAALLAIRGFSTAPLQTDWVLKRFRLQPNVAPDQMKLLLANGHTLGGADALVEIARTIWWCWPLVGFARLPGCFALLRAGYRRFAAHRCCIGGRCGTSTTDKQPLRETPLHREDAHPLDWLPLLLFTVGALATRGIVPDWVFMWLMAFAIFFGCKWLTFSSARWAAANPSLFRSLGYLFAWPGMDAKTFLRRSQSRPARLAGSAPTITAGFKTILGLLLLWAVRQSVHVAPLLTGWLAMLGLVLFLHFGLFALLASFWRNIGVEAKLVMRAPLRSTSLAEFWSERWNTAFNTLAHTVAFRPLARRWGTAAAMIGVFLISGLVHEAVISLPARGGYGLPTAYFLLQGGGVLIERSVIGRSLGLGQGVYGWLFTFAFTAIPAFWLFHPPFVFNVILPMLNLFAAK
jgi:alginate O-acetyltransferase complex protein AlgI